MSNNSVDITTLGDPRKPSGNAGKEMLDRMNESHYELTGWALDFLKFNKEDLVLDIGCGGGLTVSRISKLVNKVIGIDYSEISVEKSKLENKDNKNTEIISTSVENLPFSNDTFEKIVTVESFYFWPDPKENLKEVYRVLKPNGKFMIVSEVYNRENLSEHSLENIKKYNLFNPTREEFIDLLISAGFKEVQTNICESTEWICVLGCK